MDSKLHPAMTITNIKNLIPLTLELETSHYTTWAALFEVHCRAYQVFDHLTPPTDAATSTATDKTAAEKAAADKAAADKAAADALWKRLDAIVLQWIYGTISTDLLHTILSPGQTAHEAWTTIENQFRDNKIARQVQLNQEFSNIHLESFPSMAAYCSQVKLLADQLTGVGAPVDNQRLVTQLLSGVTEQYESVSSVLQHRVPLPTFNECRSRLTMEEKKKKQQTTRAAASAATALAASSTTSQPADSFSNRGRGRGGRSRGRGRNNNNNSNNNNSSSGRGSGNHHNTRTSSSHNLGQPTNGVLSLPTPTRHGSHLPSPPHLDNHLAHTLPPLDRHLLLLVFSDPDLLKHMLQAYHGHSTSTLHHVSKPA